MTRVEQLARYVAATRFEAFGAGVVERTKDLCLSSVGSTLLGAAMEAPRTLAEHVRASGASGEVGVLGLSFTTAVGEAAMLNCVSSHCTELEDVAWPEAQYTCCIIPAALSLAEHLGASGQAVLEAIVVGFEVAARPGMTCSNGGAAERGWLSCANVGGLGMAAAAAKLMGLSEAQTADALSLAASMGGGLVRQSGSAAHVLEAGFAGRNGITAALLGARGLGGNRAIMDGPAGYFDALAGQPDIDLRLGEGPPRIMAVGQKKFPCCYLLQRTIDSVQAVMRERSLTANDVTEVVVEVNRAFPAIVKYPEPRNGEEARFSLGHVVACALLGEPMDAATFTTAKTREPRVVQVRGRVKMAVNDAWGYDQLGARDLITFGLQGGERFTVESVVARGDAEAPLTRQETLDKFFACVKGLIPAALARETAERLCRLEQLTSVGPMLKALTSPHAAGAA